MLKKSMKVLSVMLALSLSAISTVPKAEAEVKVSSRCSMNFTTDSTSNKNRTRPNYDPKCGDYYEKCDSDGTCYECFSCSYGGPYCWETN